MNEMRLRPILRALFFCMIGFAHVSTAHAQAAGPQISAVPHMPTVAALRSLPLRTAADQPSIALDGYNRPNDGGGGQFVWDASSTAPDDDGLVISPTGSTAPGRWVRVLPEPGVLSPLYFGARCDGAGDDAIGINRALAALRRQSAPGGSGPQPTGLVRLPARQCVAKTTINSTHLISWSLMIEGTGGSILCQTEGQPCVDAMDSSRLSFRDLTLYGDQQHMPSIGLQLGRPSPHGSAAGMFLDHVLITGFFSFTAYYNLNAETQLDVKLNASNLAPDGYGAVYDGINHWNAKSAFIPITSPVDTMQSFGDNTCLNCRITSSGAGGTPVWIAGTAELTFENSYISNFNKGVGAVLYGWNTNLNFDAHFEAADLTSVFLLAGSGHPILYGLRYREHDFFGQVSMFALAKEARVATLENVEIDIGRIHSRDHGAWFDNPANYTVSGRVSGITAQGWVVPGGGFSGTACFAEKCVTQ